MARTVILPLWKKITFAMISLTVFLIVFEGAARIVFCLTYGARGSKILHAHLGNLNGPINPLNPNLKGNSLNFMGPDFEIKKSKDTFRVLTLGGSAASGDLSQKLRDHLNRHCPQPKCEVIDGGMSGAVSGQELYNLRRWISYDPDLVIVYDGWNEMYYSHYAPEQYREQTHLGRKLFHKWNKPSNWLIRYSYAVQGFREARKALKAGFSTHMAWAAEAADNTLHISWFGAELIYAVDLKRPIKDIFSTIYQQNLIGMAGEIKIHGSKALFVLQPSLACLGIRNGFEPEGERILKQLKDPVRQDWQRAVGTLQPLAHKAHEDARQVHKFPFMDFNEIAGMKQQYFEDLVHLNSTGNGWIAEKIIETCQKEGLFKSSEPAL